MKKIYKIAFVHFKVCYKWVVSCLVHFNVGFQARTLCFLWFWI